VAGFDFGKVFGKDTAAYQLFVYQVLGQFVTTLGEPAFLALSQLVLSHFPVVPLSVADAVDAAQKGHVTPDQAAAEALLAGISRERFDILLAAAQAPPAPQELVVALRRGLIPEHGEGSASTSFDQGIREGALGIKWVDVVKGLATELPSPVDALQALLEGQIDADTGKALYEKFGGDPAYFEMLFNTRGSAPTPLEASEMANRGIIPWDGSGPDVTSYEQAFLEGPWRNKWSGPYRQLAEWRPTVREVVALVKNGSVDDATALKLFKQLGATDEMAAIQLADAHHEKVAPERDLTVSTIKALYQDGLIDQTEAGTLLGALNYSAESVAFLIDVWDFQVLQAKVRSAVSKVHSLYVAHKIDAAAAGRTLDGLGVPATGKAQMLAVWTLERDANVQTLTAAEIVDAVFYSIIDIPTGIGRLIQLGWQPEDAAIRIAIRFHGKLPDNTQGAQ
jgi:hypothetical protein